MRAAAIGPHGRLEIVDKPEPEPGPGEVVVAVERCGICGSDLHLRESGLLPAGAVLGHEFGGPVVVGAPDGDGPAVGTLVAVLPARRCGTCDACTSGRSNLCPLQLPTSMGLGWRNGGYAEQVVVPSSSCHPVPPQTTPAQAALAEPYAVALHALARSRVAGDTDLAVAVLGAGSVGLMCVAALARAGVARIAVAEPRPSRASAARTMGAVAVERAGDVARALGRPPDVVFEATGAVEAPAQAVETASVGGQVVLLGVGAPGGQVAMPGLLWVVKEVDVAPSIAYTDAEYAEAVSAVAIGAADTVAAAAHHRRLADAEEAFDDLRRPDGPVKVLLDPTS
ncbi:MAG: zinc-dependent alcohol dehydrogenase [Acidimicrobiales bacterium]